MKFLNIYDFKYNKSVDSHGPPSQIKFPIESNRVIVVTGLIEHDQLLTVIELWLRTDGRTDRRTDGQSPKLSPPFRYAMGDN